jgi:hypothetical protein
LLLNYETTKNTGFYTLVVGCAQEKTALILAPGKPLLLMLIQLEQMKKINTVNYQL